MSLRELGSSDEDSAQFRNILQERGIFLDGNTIDMLVRLAIADHKDKKAAASTEVLKGMEDTSFDLFGLSHSSSPTIPITKPDVLIPPSSSHNNNAPATREVKLDSEPTSTSLTCSQQPVRMLLSEQDPVFSEQVFALDKRDCELSY